MPDQFDKGECLARAKSLLEAGGGESIRYAALELRYCMEAITYEKLRTYAKRLPEAVLERWQPPQAVRALLEFEPFAMENHRLRFAREDENGRPTGPWFEFGTHRSLKLGWLQKNYNKVGSFLHVPKGRGSRRAPDAEDLRRQMLEIAAELEPVVGSRTDSSLARVVFFECKQCRSKSVANEEGVRSRGGAVCIGCGAEYAATQEDSGNIAMAPIESKVPCGSCGAENALETRLLEEDLRFRCDACGALHRIVGQHWSYEMLDESS